MKERPILFSAPMVRAILAGAKTQTRRDATRVGGFGQITEFGRSDTTGYDWHFRDSAMRWHDLSHAQLMKACPYGQVGDRLWVRETWQYADWTEEGEPHIGYAADDKRILIEDYPETWVKRLEEVWCELSDPKNYDIDNCAADRRWRPNIHMPRWACRILLEVTGVRVERLQDISHEDAELEGVKCNMSAKGFRDHFCDLWEHLYGAGSWGANPWVWVIEFRRVK
ncbi:hypothetical protein ACIPLR_12420 [Herbaspirillum huttiense]|uniref:hypothetical protein n=1 Tax=Herbaspirillum huttiense TaxID=863372 RepID=UPI0037F4AB71